MLPAHIIIVLLLLIFYAGDIIFLVFGNVNSDYKFWLCITGFIVFSITIIGGIILIVAFSESKTKYNVNYIFGSIYLVIGTICIITQIILFIVVPNIINNYQIFHYG